MNIVLDFEHYLRLNCSFKFFYITREGLYISIEYV
jgi:hypothetical protein